MSYVQIWVYSSIDTQKGPAAYDHHLLLLLLLLLLIYLFYSKDAWAVHGKLASFQVQNRGRYLCGDRLGASERVEQIYNV